VNPFQSIYHQFLYHDNWLTLSGEAKNEIRWWQNNIFDKNGKDIRPSKIQFYLETDASFAKDMYSCYEYISFFTT
jgi:hypothetical protein